MSWRFWERATAPSPTPSEAFACIEDWRIRQTNNTGRDVEHQRAAAELQATSAPELEAVCGICAKPRRFPVAWHGRPEQANLREGLACPACGLNSRQRAALGLLRDRLPKLKARVYATEQASPVYLWLRRRYPNAIGSEFRADPARAAAIERWLADQGIPEKLRDLDATALALDSASFDAIVSFDVLEHVPDYRAALREFARCLRPGGMLVLTVPFIPALEHSLVRARLRDDGSIEHLLPEEIHGDPLSGGVLCWYHFGWDFLEAAREAGFARAEWHWTWAPEQALHGMWTLLATKA